MKTHFYYESYLARIRRYILIFLTATIFLLESAQDLSSKENIFIVEDIKIEGFFDTNFSREKFIDEAFKKSFLKLLSQILVSEDFSKLKNLSLKEIKNLIYSFKILDEKFKDQRYSAIFQVIYNDQKVKELLSKKNISYFKPKNATVIFFPIFIHDNEVKIFKENYFYNNCIKFFFAKDHKIQPT